MAKQEGSREILIERKGNKKAVVTIPADAKVTLAPMVSFSKFGHDGTESGLALRIYVGSGKENQIAVFRNVEAFRDLALPYREATVEKSGEVQWSDDGSNSTRKESITQKEVWS